MNEEEKHSSSFFNGLTLGAILGATGFFLFGTKKGRKIKNKLTTKGKNFWQELEEVIEEAKKDPEFLTKKTKKLTDEIDKKTQRAKKQVEKKVEETKEKIQEQALQAKEVTVEVAKEQAENISTVAKAVVDKGKDALDKTKQVKHFFQKAGRSLGK